MFCFYRELIRPQLNLFIKRYTDPEGGGINTDQALFLNCRIKY